MVDYKKSNLVLILGFFDGVHLGHRKVISEAVLYAKNNNAKTVLLTFPESPAIHFNYNYEYIFHRQYNYEIIKSLDVDFIEETPFDELVNIKSEEYLKMIVEKYSPIAIFSGFNYTFGKNREGNIYTLDTLSSKYNYKYFALAPVKYDNDTVSSTYIKKLLLQSDLNRASELLCEKFFIENVVIEGQKIARKLGFPTANINYPSEIVKLPYGVYKSEVMNMPAVLNWGIKPTINGTKPLIEVHIPNFNEDLYGKILKVKFIAKIRDEEKFSSIEELKVQIKKDIDECLK